MCHVTLHWIHERGHVRTELEAQLARRIDGARAFDNPAASWFLGLSGFLFGLAFLTALVLVLTRFFPGRRW